MADDTQLPLQDNNPIARLLAEQTSTEDGAQQHADVQERLARMLAISTPHAPWTEDDKIQLAAMNALCERDAPLTDDDWKRLAQMNAMSTAKPTDDASPAGFDGGPSAPDPVRLARETYHACLALGAPFVPKNPERRYKPKRRGFDFER